MSEIRSDSTSIDRAQRGAVGHAVHAQARALLGAGDTECTFRMLSGLATSGSPHWQVYNDLAALAVSSGGLGTACDLLGAALERGDAPPLVTIRRTELHAASGRTEEAGEALALARDIIGSARSSLSAVVWARLSPT